MSNALDLGYGATYRFAENSAGERSGGIFEHPGACAQCAEMYPNTPGRCSSGVLWRGKGYDDEGRPLWNVVQVEPLTLSPSILCHCGFHGFIREGKWVPA